MTTIDTSTEQSAPASTEIPAAAPTTDTLPQRLRVRFDAAQERLVQLPAVARAVVQERLAQVPVAARAAGHKVATRVREALDIPSRTEIAELAARLAELDTRIAQLTTGRGAAAPTAELPAVAEAAPVEATATVEAAAAEATAPETDDGADGDSRSNKHQRRQNAAKSARR